MTANALVKGEKLFDLSKGHYAVAVGRRPRDLQRTCRRAGLACCRLCWSTIPFAQPSIGLAGSSRKPSQ